MKIKKSKRKLIIQSTRHIIQKCWFIMPHHHVCTVRWSQSLKRKNLQGLFWKNLQITGLESKLFFTGR